MEEFSSYLPVNFVILRIIELLTRKLCILLKSRLLFNISYCFCMFAIVLVVFISKSKRSYNVKPSAYYFLCEYKDNGRLSYQHQCSFKAFALCLFSLHNIHSVEYQQSHGVILLTKNKRVKNKIEFEFGKSVR